MFDVVIQGPSYNYLSKVVESYRLPFVKNIIYSGWEDDPTVQLATDIIQVKSKKPKLPGHGNINYQVQTTKAGLDLVTSNYVLKTRSDICLRPEQLAKFYDFCLKHNKILTTGIGPQYAFYTLDFIYFGKTDNLKLLYGSCPYNESINYYPDYAKGIISETALGAWYIANFEEKVKQICDNKDEYLGLNSPNYKYSLEVTKQVIEKYFVPLPCIDILWLKHYNNFRNMRQILYPRTDDYYSADW